MTSRVVKQVKSSTLHCMQGSTMKLRYALVRVLTLVQSSINLVEFLVLFSL